MKAGCTPSLSCPEILSAFRSRRKARHSTHRRSRKDLLPFFQAKQVAAVTENMQVRLGQLFQQVAGRRWWPYRVLLSCPDVYGTGNFVVINNSLRDGFCFVQN